MVYVAFVIDAYSRRILGWRTATSMRTSLVLDALEHAVWIRHQEGVTDLAGLICHHDAGSQYTSIAFTERLAEGRDRPIRGLGRGCLRQRPGRVGDRAVQDRTDPAVTIDAAYFATADPESLLITGAVSEDPLNVPRGHIRKGTAASSASPPRLMTCSAATESLSSIQRLPHRPATE
jgi:putative transposase